MSQPRLLDLYCGAGGAARGYQRAGFHVTGVDIRPQPHYTGDAFLQGDVLKIDPDWIADGFDAVHASPPCQFGTALRSAPGAKVHLNLIPETKIKLGATRLPWIIENVDSSKVRPFMRGALKLCGSTFGLEAEGHELRRHRLFLSNVLLFSEPCRHRHGAPVIGVYGGHARRRAAKHGGRGTADVWASGHLGAASTALGIDWMTLGELSEAIPPAFTEYLGRQLLRVVERWREAA
jgi:DNA (cytosine-5)-methyltransferase 1